MSDVGFRTYSLGSCCGIVCADTVYEDIPDWDVDGADRIRHLPGSCHVSQVPVLPVGIDPPDRRSRFRVETVKRDSIQHTALTWG